MLIFPSPLKVSWRPSERVSALGGSAVSFAQVFRLLERAPSHDPNHHPMRKIACRLAPSCTPSGLYPTPALPCRGCRSCRSLPWQPVVISLTIQPGPAFRPLKILQRPLPSCLPLAPKRAHHQQGTSQRTLRCLRSRSSSATRSTRPADPTMERTRVSFPSPRIELAKLSSQPILS